MEEVYKDIVGFEGVYQISNLGNVKSLNFNKERMLKKIIDNKGYFNVGLCKNSICKTTSVHQLVAEAFLNHIRCGYKLVINHIDFNKTNNNINNLEIVTARENSNKKHLKSSSKYIGVGYDKRDKTFYSQILIGKKRIRKNFKTELEAYDNYQYELNKYIINEN